MGYDADDWRGKPVIGIINTWSDINACHAHLRSRAEDVKRGVLQAGGFPIELPAISLAEPFVKPSTMLYRNFLAMETEELLRSHPIDGAVLLGGCDKTTPGLIMGAISMGLPAIYCPAGPMLRGNWRGQTLGSGSDAWKYWDEKRAGRISEADWAEMEGGICALVRHLHDHGHGRHHDGDCRGAGVDAAGRLVDPGGGCRAPAHVRQCGPAHRRDGVGGPDGRNKILTPAAFENAIKVHMAMGGSTNAIIHVVAMARRAGIALSLEQFDHISRQVPVIANVRPSGAYLMEDFFYAGGVRALMKLLAGKLDGSAATVNGRTLGENFAGAEVFHPDVIRALDKAIYAEGATAVLKGNLAPRGAVMKPSAAEPRLRQHRGKAIVFRDYNHMARAGGARRSRRDARPCAGAAKCRTEGRTGHARMGHAADPAQAGARRRARHAAHFGRPHVAAPATAPASCTWRRRVSLAGRWRWCRPATRSRWMSRSGACTCTSPMRNWRGGGRRGCAPQPRYERGYGRMFQEHIGQADEGCDFDFLEHGAPTPEPEIH